MQTENYARIVCQRQAMLGHAPHCGDGVWTCWHAQGLFGLLCDGSGHGPEAEHIQQLAIATARPMVEQSDYIDLAALFQALHARLRSSRGMVALAFVLHADGGLDYIHIGDVSLLGLHPDGSHLRRSNEQQGIIGYHMPTPALQHWQCQSGQWLVVHSDGIRRSTPSRQWQRLLQPGCSVLTASLNMMRELADGRDDAACIVVRYWGHRSASNMAEKETR